MDLSKLTREPPPPPKLRVARLPRPPAEDEPGRADELPEGMDAPDLPVFEGGESLSPEEQESASAQAEAEWLGENRPTSHVVLEGDPEYEGLVEQLRKATQAGPHGEFPFTDLDTETEVFVPSENGGSTQPRMTRHFCIVEPCSWYLDVPPVSAPSMAALLGAGPGLAAVEQAREVEQRLTEHLHTHSVLEWATALKQAQDERDAARSSPGVITSGYAPPVEGIIPGPNRRDPEREAAVRAMDARLGRTVAASGEGLSIEERNAADQRLREARARLRARQVTPYDLTPQYRADLEAGVVGIKR